MKFDERLGARLRVSRRSDKERGGQRRRCSSSDWPCSVHRAPGRRVGGLAGAVVAGINDTVGSWVCVMDGDLQHPPEVLVDMLGAASAHGADLVAGTRYSDGGDYRSLGRVRTLVSRSSTLAARARFPRTLARVSDPMSGFFLVRRKSVDCRALIPRGFKILLEILVSHRDLRCAEVPYHFDARVWGETKASFRQGLEYAEQLLNLRLEHVVSRPAPFRRVLQFSAIGISGVALNELIMSLLVERGVVGYVGAAVIATEAATLWNFTLLHRFVFHDSETRGIGQRLVAYVTLSNALFALSLPALAILVSGVGLHYTLASLVVIGVQFVLRLLISDRVIWRHRASEAKPKLYVMPRRSEPARRSAARIDAAEPRSTEMV